MAVPENDVLELQFASSDNTPLFLIHDGGGTVLQYLSLGILGRNVYGIQDPKLESHDGWEGGMIEMASEYIKLIRTIRREGPILLGGWSLGGLVSLQIARLLDDERKADRTEHDTPPLFVAGVILIDSPYTVPRRENRHRFADFKPEFPPWTAERTRKGVTRRLEVCDELIDTWDPPRWDTYSGRNTENIVLHAASIPSDLSGNQGSALKHQKVQIRPASSSPPVVLLKATAYVPVTETHTNTDPLLDVDLFRDDQSLGWSQHAEKLLSAVHNLPGHHFELFDEDDKVEAITNILKETCDGWDSPDT